MVVSRVGPQTVEPDVLLLPWFQLADLVQLHANIVFLPALKRLLTGAGFANQIRDRYSDLSLLPNRYDLFSKELLQFHWQNLFIQLRHCAELTLKMDHKVRSRSGLSCGTINELQSPPRNYPRHGHGCTRDKISRYLT